MKQARRELRLTSWVLVFGLFLQISACQQSGPLQGTVAKPTDKKGSQNDKGKDDDAEAERITPPNNIVGSYLVCQEGQQFGNIQQNAVVQCGVYREPQHIPVSVSSLSQWQMSGSTAALRALTPNSASQVELRFQAADELSLKNVVRRTKLSVRDDSGESFEGLVSDLMPADSRLSTAAATKTGTFALTWSEGFEGTKINADSWLFHDPRAFVSSVTFNWVNPTTQNPACGTPLFEIMQFATLEGGVDNVGAAEGQQFLDTDSACWPNTSNAPIRGASNLSVSRDFSLAPGRVYRVSFKVRQQPLPNGIGPFTQGLQLKINQNVVKDVRTFTNTWQEYTVDWVAGDGVSKIEWVDVGAADDSVGVLLDDLRVQVQNF